jgi:hypothetical protein
MKLDFIAEASGNSPAVVLIGYSHHGVSPILARRGSRATGSGYAAPDQRNRCDADESTLHPG